MHSLRPHLRHGTAPFGLQTLGLATLLFLLASAASAGPPAAEVLSVETLFLFDPERLENPESIVFDKEGSAYVSMAPSGEIQKITSDGERTIHAVTPNGTPRTSCFGRGNPLGGLIIDGNDHIYASVNSCDPESHGVWRVDPDGSLHLVGRFPTPALLNGIELVGRDLYVSDSRLGLVWTVSADGGEPRVWVEDPVLANDPDVLAPGPNGIQFYAGELYVANSSTARMLAIRIGPDGEAREIREHAVLPFGCDDFAFDARGYIYCTTDPANRILQVSPDGFSEVILDDTEFLDGPSDATFGHKGGDRFFLYVTNAAFPIFTVTNRPSLMRMELTVPGAPN